MRKLYGPEIRPYYISIYRDSGCKININDEFFVAVNLKKRREINLMNQEKRFSERKYLELLAEKYPTIQSAATEIINYEALRQLPKGTEHFMSDLHGEYEAFIHILNNASGEIRQKVDKLYGKVLTSAERAQLSTLIYYPEEKLKELKDNGIENIGEWYLVTLHQLIEVCHLVSLKYSRRKVRRAIPPEYAFIINELINAEDTQREEYYEQIIQTIIEIGSAEDMIVAIATVIKRLIVDHLHIVGDLFDRGQRPDIIIERLMDHHAVDIQWGNHDVLWMGAAAGSPACIAAVLFNAIKYGNLDSLETAYGINLRPLAIFAQEMYPASPRFALKQSETVHHSKDITLLSKMYHAVAILLFKLEGQLIERHPEYNMDDRKLLERIDFSAGTIQIDGKAYEIDVADLKTVNPKKPYELTGYEASIVRQLVTSFTNSYKLQAHIRFIYGVGSIHLVFNGNLMFHGCVPMNADGSFMEMEIAGERVSGRALFEAAETLARQGYYADPGSQEKADGMDFLWFLWCGRNSPLFGRDHITTFERLFIEDHATWKEADNPYYKMIDDPGFADILFEAFELNPTVGHIINGHVPVAAQKGESPIKGGGKIIVIDGGFCKAYQPKTGIAGYTLIYDSYGMRIAAHEPFPGLDAAISNNSDILSQEEVFDAPQDRLKVGDSDVGKRLERKTQDLKKLLNAFRQGWIKQSGADDPNQGGK